MSGVRDLIRGSEKVIDHYRVLLAGTKNEKERELYRSRIEREERLLEDIRGGVALDRTGALLVVADDTGYAAWRVSAVRAGH